MRRLMPMWSSLVALLLLLQAVGALAMPAGMPHLPGSAAVICHTEEGQPPTPTDQAPTGHSPAHHAGTMCPLCAPLPPVILAGPPVPLPPPPSAYHAAPRPTPPLVTLIPTRLALQQPRAPPPLS